MATVTILGSTGMLGSSVVQEFANFAGSLHGSLRSREINPLLHKSYSLDAADQDLPEELKSLGPEDFVINCIGVIKPYITEESSLKRKNAILINSLFPYSLDNLAAERGFKVIQIATDCVFSGSKGGYLETDSHDALDTYGKTKSLGEVPSDQMMNIRVSIIGPEHGRSTSLFEWVRNQPENSQIFGYSDHVWNGITTGSFGRICRGIVENNGFIPGAHHLLPSDSMTKYELVQEIAKKCKRQDIEIIERPSGTHIDRTLATVNNARNLEFWQDAGYLSIPTIAELIAEIAL